MMLAFQRVISRIGRARRKALRCIAGIGLLVPVALLPSNSMAQTGACNAALAVAAGKHESCVQKALAKLYLSYLSDYDLTTSNWEFAKIAGKCATKYSSTWTKLQAKPSLSCGSRFEVTNGTVIDHLTGLQWEVKDDSGGVHDRDNRYTWNSNSAEATQADGTAFSSFLSTLNASGFAGNYDWRMPTVSEMLTIVTPSFPDCQGTSAYSAICIDESLFGPMPLFDSARHQYMTYWTSTTFAVTPTLAFAIYFFNGQTFIDYKMFAGFGNGSGVGAYVRAVRSVR